jgi:hypothetical protein
MMKFEQICSKFEQIKLDKYKKLNNELGFWKKNALNNYCQVSNKLHTEQSPPNITYFTEINSTTMKTITQLVSMDRSKCEIFDFYFRETLVNLKSSQEIQLIIVYLFETTLKKWKNLADDIEKESIKLSRLDEIIDKFFHSNFTKMYDELEYLLNYFKQANTSKRLNQIKLWYKFKASYEAANSIQIIKTELSLTNEFVQLIPLLQISSEKYLTWRLNEMNTEIANTVKCLEEMNDRTKLNCLKAFSKSLKLVDWLKENVKDLNALKLFVDSIVMSAALDKSNQASDRIALAKTLKQAGTAYSALIYDLRPDDDFNQFMQLCSKVCSFLESDQHIAEYLITVSDKVDLFDNIRSKNESAELEMLKVAKYLNKNGVYIINTRTQGNENEIDNLIRLQTHDETYYSFNDLKDLQNVLLLIAPRSTSAENDQDEFELKYFIQMFERISQLALKYLQLIQYGCIFFDKFKIEIKCDIENKSNRTRVNELTNSIDNSIDCVNYLINYLDSVNTIWSDYVTRLRAENDCLNYFTIKQLKYINLKLKNLNPESFRDIQPILFDLNSNLTLNELKLALEQPFENNSNNHLDLKIDSFLLKDNKFNQSLINQWTQFISDKNREFLSLKHLAKIFSSIHKQKIIKRKIPGYLNQRGQPNLITCSLHEQIPIVLSIYAHTFECEMPTNDEVIYCDSNTTYEDLEIFLRRGFASNGNKIYTLINVQDLKYEPVSKLENILVSNHSKQIKKSDSFVLVFICCTISNNNNNNNNNNNKTSLISSLLAKNKVQPIQLLAHDLEIYLDKNLQTSNRSFMLDSFNLNKKAYSVKALLSQRSGNGKSSYVKHLVDNLKKKKLNFDYKILRIKSSRIDLNNEINKFTSSNNNNKSTIYHIDLAYEVFHGVDQYLFNLIVTGYFKNSTTGLVWRRNKQNDLFLIEMSPPCNLNSIKFTAYHSMLNFLPRIEFRTPLKYLFDLKNVQTVENLNSLSSSLSNEDNLFSHCYKEIRYQRCVYYLKLVNRIKQEQSENQNGLNQNGAIDYPQNTNQNLNERFNQNFQPNEIEYSEIDCLESLNQLTKLSDPNWNELNNFVNFLDQQLDIFERSTVIKMISSLKSLVAQLLVMMSNDFGLPSLNINFREINDNGNAPPPPVFRRQQSAIEIDSDFNLNIDLSDLQITENRRWENMIHPYIIFNADGESIVFLGTYMDRISHKFINPQTNKPIEDPDIPRVPYAAL